MMKTKNMFWAALSMTAALVMTACSSDDNMMTPAALQGEVKTIPYSVTVNEGVATNRASVDSDNKTLKFAAGDKLYITGMYISGVLTLKSGDEGKSSGATFEGDLTYTGGGSPASNLTLAAVLVGTNNQGWNIVDGKATIFSYPDNAYCSSVNDAVEQYSNLTGTSKYSAKSFTLTQQTAFLNFEITFEDGTAAGTPLTTVVSNNGSALCTANVTTVDDGGVKAKFVLPVMSSATTLSGATVKMGDKAALTINDATLTAKVYNVKKTQKAAATAHELSASVVGDVVGSDGKAYAAADKDNLPTGVTAAGMVAYKSGSNGLAIALANEASKMNWSTANGASGAAAHTPTVTGQTWKLPSKDEWDNMISAAGSYTDLRDGISSVGGTNMQSDDRYWSSTESDSGYAWVYNFSNGKWGNGYNDFEYYVRACLAF